MLEQSWIPGHLALFDEAPASRTALDGFDAASFVDIHAVVARVNCPWVMLMLMLVLMLVYRAFTTYPAAPGAEREVAHVVVIGRLPGMS